MTAIVVLLIVCLLISSSAAGGYLWYKKNFEQTAEKAIKGLKEGVWVDASSADDNLETARVMVQTTVPGITLFINIFASENDQHVLVNRRGTIQIETVALQSSTPQDDGLSLKPRVVSASESEIIRTKLGTVTVESDSKIVIMTNDKKTTYIYRKPLSDIISMFSSMLGLEKEIIGSEVVSEITAYFNSTEFTDFLKRIIANPPK